MTTRFPNEPESDRRIVGLFQIGEILDGPDSETTLIATSNGRVRLRMEEAKRLYFWEYYTSGSGRPDWRTGLFRYIDDGQVHRILADISAKVQDKDTKALINGLVTQAFGKGSAPPASGYSVRKSR